MLSTRDPRFHVRFPRSVAALSLVAMAATGMAALPATASVAAADDAGGPNLVVNGSFDGGTTGWRTNDASTTDLQSVDSGRTAAPAAKLTSTSPATVVLNDAQNTVTDVVKGTHYTVEAWVRTPDPNASGQLRVREVDGDQVKTFKTGFWLTDAKWHRVTLNLTTAYEGSHLDLNVLAWHQTPGAALLVDDVSMIESSSGGTPGGSISQPPGGDTSQPPGGDTSQPPGGDTGTPGSSAGTLTNGCSYSQRGIPDCGAYVGATLQGNADPTAFESQMGQHLGVHRTFWRGDQVDSAVRTAKRDLAHRRVPWISFKLPHSWRQMANGAGDAWARDLAAKLSRLDGPVWVAFHHEPQHDGDITQWTAMQERLAPIVRNTAPNVAYSIILSGWNSVSGAKEYRLSSLWPKNTKIDILGVDTYNRDGVPQAGGRRQTDGKLHSLEKIAAWAKQRGIAWGISETGYTDFASKQDPTWISRAYKSVVDKGGIAFAYFNSDGNSVASWDLSTKAKRQDFAKVLQGSPSLPK